MNVQVLEDVCDFSPQVHLSAVGSGLTIDDTIVLYCGDGEQILQWVGYTVCARLAYKRGEQMSLISMHSPAHVLKQPNLCAGEVHGRYVPQSVTNKDGQPQDIDIVINEIFADGDEVYVEYSSGPMPYRVR